MKRVCGGMEHKLKVDPIYFWELWNGNKTFEVRKADRPRYPDMSPNPVDPGSFGFGVNDWLVLREWSEKGGYSGHVIKAKVTFVLEHEDFPGVAKGYEVLGIKVTRVGYKVGEVDVGQGKSMWDCNWRDV